MDYIVNGIVVHANKSLHSIQLESAQVLEPEQYWMKCHVKEALCIRNTQNFMNLDRGLQINPIWDTIT